MNAPIAERLETLKEAALQESEQAPAITDSDLLASLGGLTEEVTSEPNNDKELAEPTSTHAPGVTSSIKERALALLGSGVHAESVAAALGVTPARISQLLAEDAFSAKVAQLRYENLQAHNKRDGSYDDLEDKLLSKLKSSLPLMVKPDTILKAINVVNGAKRRGQSTPQQVTNQQNIVNLILPTGIAEKFSVQINTQNQVIRAGKQELLTMPSGNLLKQVEEATEQRLLIESEQETNVQGEESN